MCKIYIFGSDARQNNLKTLYQEYLVESLEEADIIILPTPVSRDGVKITGEEMCLEDLRLESKKIFGGVFPKSFVRKMQMQNNECIDLMLQDEISVKNAVPTAEGVIKKIIEETTTCIYGTNILVLGYGRCGKVLVDRLYGMKANVYCMARKPKDIAQIEITGGKSVNLSDLEKYLPSMDVIINTVPFMILTAKKLDLLKKDSLIIDIATAPGGTDFDYAKSKNIKAYLEGAIPTKIAPLSSAMYIKEYIDKVIN